MWDTFPSSPAFCNCVCAQLQLEKRHHDASGSWDIGVCWVENPAMDTWFERICATPLKSAPWAGKKRILLAKEKQPLSYSEGKNKQQMLENLCFLSPSPCTLRSSEILSHFKGGVEICEWKKIREIWNISLTLIVLSIKKNPNYFTYLAKVIGQGLEVGVLK